MESFNSPILTLVNCITTCVINIAPRHEGALKEFLTEHNPKIVITDERREGIRIDLKCNEIKLPIRALEYIWCCGFAYYVIYKEYYKSSLRSVKSIKFDECPTIKSAWRLLEWGYFRTIKTSAPDWPTDLPSPLNFIDVNEEVEVANELFLCALAWIILHEMYHVVLDRQYPLEDRIKLEEQCDRRATEWIFHEDVSEDETKKRSFAITVALLSILGSDIVENKFTYSTHPMSYKRIYDCLEISGLDENHIGYAFSFVILLFYLSDKGITVNSEQLSAMASHKDSLRELIIKTAQARQN